MLTSNDPKRAIGAIALCAFAVLLFFLVWFIPSLLPRLVLSLWLNILARRTILLRRITCFYLMCCGEDPQRRTLQYRLAYR